MSTTLHYLADILYLTAIGSWLACLLLLALSATCPTNTALSLIVASIGCRELCQYCEIWAQMFERDGR
jgi:hypothetical protein